MSEPLVEQYSEVVDNVKAFNEGLTQDARLGEKLSYFRAWYYIPELDAVGPSKFIGYKDMTASRYDGKVLDGRDSEYYLSEWFGPLEKNTAEARYVEQKVRELLESHNRALNSVARFCAPYNWRLNQSNVISRPDVAQTNLNEVPNPMVEVFWRAFLTLYPRDQEDLATRVSEYMRKK